MADNKPEVAVIMGSASDWETMKHACEMLDQFEVPYMKQVISAHRTPELMGEFAHNARANGLKVIIAGAGGATGRAGTGGGGGVAAAAGGTGKGQRGGQQKAVRHRLARRRRDRAREGVRSDTNIHPHSPSPAAMMGRSSVTGILFSSQSPMAFGTTMVMLSPLRFLSASAAFASASAG